MRYFIVGGPVDVIEDGARKSPARQLTEVMKVDAMFQAHVGPDDSSVFSTGNLGCGREVVKRAPPSIPA
jgi:hypothetical protein